MSAFVCNDTHITFLAHYAMTRKFPLVSGLTLEQVGQLLLDANYESVNHRYRETHHHTFKPTTAGMWRAQTPLQVIKAAHCSQYQSCEYPEWEGSPAFRNCTL